MIENNTIDQLVAIADKSDKKLLIPVLLEYITLWDYYQPDSQLDYEMKKAEVIEQVAAKYITK